MIYDLYVQFVGGNNPDFQDMLYNSPGLQKAFAACSFALTVFAIIAICYVLIVIFRGWK